MHSFENLQQSWLTLMTVDLSRTGIFARDWWIVSWRNQLDSDNQLLWYPLHLIFFESNVRFISPTQKAIITFQIRRIKIWYWHHSEALNEIYQMMLFFFSNSPELNSYDHFLNSPSSHLDKKLDWYPPPPLGTNLTLGYLNLTCCFNLPIFVRKTCYHRCCKNNY